MQLRSGNNLMGLIHILCYKAPYLDCTPNLKGCALENNFKFGINCKNFYLTCIIACCVHGKKPEKCQNNKACQIPRQCKLEEIF